MSQPQHKPDPAAKGRPFMEEADIGSGEKTPAQVETEELIRQIPPLPPSDRPAPGRQGPSHGDKDAGQRR